MVCPDAEHYERSYLGISGYITMLVLHGGNFVAHGWETFISRLPMCDLDATWLERYMTIFLCLYITNVDRLHPWPTISALTSITTVSGWVY